MSLTRRRFIKQAAAASVALSFPTIIPRQVLGGPGYTPPSEQIHLGMVGVGGQGRFNATRMLEIDEVRIVAIADPSEYSDLSSYYYRTEAGTGPVLKMLNEHAANKGWQNSIRVYKDFEKMLEQEPALDGIVCSTPDHTHFYVSAKSLLAGKHVYCEKPLTHNIWEARELKRIARESGLATQMGNYGHSEPGLRRTLDLLKAGLIGEVKESHSWAHATRWNQGLTHFPPPPSPIPPGFDWNLWLGPAAEVDYSNAFCPVNWRDFWRFGTGALGDFGCHDMDSAIWAYNLRHPETVEVHPGGYRLHEWNPEIAPYAEIGTFKFKAQGDQKAHDIFWYSGGLRPPHHESMPEAFRIPHRGEMFVGEKGVIQSDGSGASVRIFPRELRELARDIPETTPRSKGHFRDWTEAIKGGPPCHGDFAYSAELTEIVLLGVLSLRMNGAPIHWDHDNMRSRGLPQADQFIRPAVRKGWEIS